MNVLGNARYQETENKIQQALFTLLEKKSINKISVRDICSHASISRPSFYSHYDDINDLIYKIEIEKSSYISSLFTSSQPMTLESFVKYLSYVKENSSFYIAYFQSENNPHISRTLIDQYLSSNHLEETRSLHYNMLFFMAGIKAIVYEWLIHDAQDSVEVMAEILYQHYELVHHA